MLYPHSHFSFVVHKSELVCLFAYPNIGNILWDVAQWKSSVCAAHRLQNAIKHAVGNQSMQRLLAKCRHLVGHFKHSALATDGLIRKQKLLASKRYFMLSKKH